jgi:hypothetical protein
MTNQVLTTNNQSDSAGIVNTVLGNVVSDAGTPTAETFAVGFDVRYLRWVNATSTAAAQILEWYQGMANGTALVTAGTTGVTTVSTTAGPTFQTGALGRSFTMPAASVPASSTFYYKAEG